MGKRTQKRRTIVLLNRHFDWFRVSAMAAGAEKYGRSLIARCRGCGARNADITGIGTWPKATCGDRRIGLATVRELHHALDCMVNLSFEADLAEVQLRRR